MRTYIFRRLIVGAFTLLGSVTIIFFMIHLVPGDPVLSILKDQFSQEAYDTMRQALGLDRSLAVQYGAYLANLVRGNLGESFMNHQGVAASVMAAFPFTLNLSLAGILLAALIGIPAGVVAAVYRNRWPDYVSMVGALIAVSAPSFLLAVLLVIAFALKLEWLPTVGAGVGFWDTVVHLILPGVTVGARAAGVLARMTRSSLLEVLGLDYIRTALAKGLTPRSVVVRHALRNAGIPVLTVLGLELGQLLGGTAIIEMVFARRGLGNMLVEAVRTRDFPLIQGTLLLYMMIVLTVNLATDLTYGAIDPRVRYS